MIYFIRMDGTQYIKIGYTSKDTAEDRVKSLQTGCPSPIRIIATLDGDETIEQELHTLFCDKRTFGGREWFEVDNTTLNEILEEYNARSSSNTGAVGGASAYDVRPIRGGQQYPIASARKDVPDRGSPFDHASDKSVFSSMRRKYKIGL